MAQIDWKSKEEVEEYLKNLHMEYQFGCLSEKKPEVCHLLGEYMESIKQEYKQALQVYKDNCDTNKFGKSCTKYGNFRLIGRGCNKDVSVAYKYTQKGCELGDSRGCLHAGFCAISQEKVEPSKEIQLSRGIEMLKKSCDAGEEKGCFVLSGIFLTGIEGFIEKDMKQAYELSLKCCELGNPYACSNVSVMHKRGDGVQMNLDLAQTFKTRADNLLKELKSFKNQLKFHEGIDP